MEIEQMKKTAVDYRPKGDDMKYIIPNLQIQVQRSKPAARGNS